MFYGKRALILTCLLAMLAGTGLHFLYEWLPNPVTALLSPINESLWEHIKLIYWPYLAAALWLNRGRPGGIRPWLLALPIMSGLMLLLGYLYHIVLGGEAMAVDIAIFVAVMVFGFWFSTRTFPWRKVDGAHSARGGNGHPDRPVYTVAPGPYPIHRFVQDWGLVPDPLLMLGSP